VDERAGDREPGPPDTDGGAEPVPPGAGPAQVAPSGPATGRLPPEAPLPYALLPRAAGGGAGAVAALVMLATGPKVDDPAPEPIQAADPILEVDAAAPPALETPPPAEPAPIVVEPAAIEPPEAHVEPATLAEVLAPQPPAPVLIRLTIPTVEPVRARAPIEREPPGLMRAVPGPPPMPPSPTAPGPSFEAFPAPPRHPLPRTPTIGDLRRYLRLAIWGAAGLMLAYIALLLTLVVLYRFVDPPTSTLMLGQRLTGTAIRHRWAPLERISPNLRHAVIISEDGSFCRHHGVDWGELAEAIDNARDGVARGGSTISMQVVKNLFLWPSRSYVRKAIEIPMAYLIEAAWSKRRILEIYLNIAEWGPGIFGADAAALYHFRKPPSLLTPREAALLAVSLPNPFEREAGSPGPGTIRLADNLLLRMRGTQASAGCVRTPQSSR